MHIHKVIKVEEGAAEVAQWVRASAIKPEDPSLIPSTHLVGGENLLLDVVLCAFTHALFQCTDAHTHV